MPPTTPSGPELLRQRGVGAVVFVLAACSVLLAGPGPAFAGTTDPQRFGFGQPMRVEAHERVDTVVTVGGDLLVLGEVEDDAVVLGGTLELGPGARVGDDAVAIGGVIVSPEGAVIGGDRVEFNGSVGRDLDRAAVEIGPLASSVGTFVQVFASFLISILLLAFAPRRVRSVAEQIRVHPGRAALLGLALLLLFVPLLGVLTVTIVGIPLIPVAIMLLAAVLVFGMTALALRLGYAMPFYSDRRSAMGALAIGYLLLGVIALLPWIGALLIPLFGLFAGGAVLASWLGGRQWVSESSPS